MSTYSLTLRTSINRKLTSREVDNNFLYVQGLALSGGGTFSYGGSTFSRDTYSNWVIAMNNGTLPVGQFVEIIDRANAGVLLYCSATNSFALEGTGCFMNADYQGIGDYSSVEGYAGWEGIWNTSSESGYINGYVVIWNNNHYEVVDVSAVNGDSPDSNTEAYYQLTSPTDGPWQQLGFIFEWDIIIYDFINDNIKWRIDKRGNKISLWNSNFQWGDDKIKSIGMSTYESYIYIVNSNGYINGSLSGLYSQVYIYNNTNTIFFDIDGSSVELWAHYNSGNIECHIDGFNSGLSTTGNSGDIRVYIYDSSYVQANNNSADIYAEYRGNSQVYHDNNTSAIQYSEFVNSYIENLNSIYLYECSINGLSSDGYYDFNGLSGTWSNKCYTPYESTFDYVIDNTYLTPSGLSPSFSDLYFLTIPSELSFIGSFNLNLDTPYSIFKIIGTTENLPIKFESNNNFYIYSMTDPNIDNDFILSLSNGGSNGLSPISASDSYNSYNVYPVQYWSNSGVSSYIEFQRKSNNLSINRIFNYGGWLQTDLPIVVTATIINLTSTSANSGGNVLNEGNSSVTVKGVCLNTTGNPTTSDASTTDGANIGAFISDITGMISGTTYYLRAYATNNSGTSYGNQLIIATP